MERLRNVLSFVRGQLWLIPMLAILGAGGLAYLLLQNGSAISPTGGEQPWWLYGGEADTARDLLASLLSGLITMTSLIVSVTFVILTLVANQLGPRIISMFMADRQIQSVLSLFIGTIFYIILVFRSIEGSLGDGGVPHLAVTVGTLLTMLSFLALLLYIHKIARSIIADNVVESAWKGLSRDLRQILPDQNTFDSQRLVSPTPLLGASMSLQKAGYIQVIDYGRLVSLASENDLVLEVRVRAGHYVLRAGDHVLVHGAEAREDLANDVRSAFTIGSSRTAAQDPEHGISQLVEIATRALSPGINDLFTARAVIDRLGAAFEVILSRETQPRFLRDRQGVLRVVADRSDLPGMLAAAFHPIREAASGSPGTLIRIADTISKVVSCARDGAQAEAMRDQLARLAETASLGNLARADREDVLSRINEARSALDSVQLKLRHSD
jgi:uncharacterized membrane protein